MSLISSRLSLVHRCALERATAAAGSWNVPGPATWGDHLTDVPCVMNMNAGRERTDDDTAVVIEDIRLLVPLGTDVTERDRIGDISFRGDTILDGPTGIRAVLHRRDHLELVLVRLS